MNMEHTTTAIAEQGQVSTLAAPKDKSTLKRRGFLKKVSAGFCGIPLLAQQEVIAQTEQSDEDTCEDKIRRVFSVFTQEELNSIQISVKKNEAGPMFLCPGLKGKAGLALMLVSCLYWEENPDERPSRKRAESGGENHD